MADHHSAAVTVGLLHSLGLLEDVVNLLEAGLLKPEIEQVDPVLHYIAVLALVRERVQGVHDVYTLCRNLIAKHYKVIICICWCIHILNLGLRMIAK